MRPSAPPEPAQCHLCHACHAKAVWSATPAKQDKRWEEEGGGESAARGGPREREGGVNTEAAWMSPTPSVLEAGATRQDSMEREGCRQEWAGPRRDRGAGEGREGGREGRAARGGREGARGGERGQRGVRTRGFGGVRTRGRPTDLFIRASPLRAIWLCIFFEVQCQIGAFVFGKGCLSSGTSPELFTLANHCLPPVTHNRYKYICDV